MQLCNVKIIAQLSSSIENPWFHFLSQFICFSINRKSQYTAKHFIKNLYLYEPCRIKNLFPQAT